MVAGIDAPIAMTLDQIRTAERMALDAWKDCARSWDDLNAQPYQTSSVQDGTNVLVAQARMRMAARAWAQADRALRAALESERAA